jgi:hypothetical protein
MVGRVQEVTVAVRSTACDLFAVRSIACELSAPFTLSRIQVRSSLFRNLSKKR